jgi:hypothetical protein
MTRFDELLGLLASAGVEFLVVGGIAAAAHRSPRGTQGLDIVYSRRPDNLQKLVDALAAHRPYLRGATPGLPFRLDVETLSAGLNFTLTTDLGWIDLLGQIAGGGRYEDLTPHAVRVKGLGTEFDVLDVETLIRTKRAAGRPKDLESIAELELLRDRKARL